MQLKFSRFSISSLFLVLIVITSQAAEQRSASSLVDLMKSLNTSDSIAKLGYWQIKQQWTKHYAELVKEENFENFLLADESLSFVNAKGLIAFAEEMNAIETPEEAIEKFDAIENNLYWESLQKKSKTLNLDKESSQFNRLWLENIFVVELKETIRLYDEKKISAKKASDRTFTLYKVIWYDLLGVMTGLSKQYRDEENALKYLEMLESGSVFKVDPSLKRKYAEFIEFEFYEWKSQREVAFVGIDKKDTKAVDAFLATSLVEARQMKDGNVEAARKKFRQVNTFFLSVYYPKKLQNRPTIVELGVLLDLEKEKGTLTEATYYLFKDFISDFFNE